MECEDGYATTSNRRELMNIAKQASMDVILQSDGSGLQGLVLALVQAELREVEALANSYVPRCSFLTSDAPLEKQNR